jgi:hypothetical protein
MWRKEMTKKIIQKIRFKFYSFLFTLLTGVKRISTSFTSTTHYVFSNQNNLGVFYDSHSRKQHLSYYEPDVSPPKRSICGTAINFSATGSEDKICEECYKELFKNCRLKSIARFMFNKLRRKNT